MSAVPKLALTLPADWADSPITVHIIGAGGTGGQVADQLASMEVTLRALGHPGFNVTLHDHDNVARSNLGRQRFSQSDLGLNKAILLCHRINMFYGLKWKAEPREHSGAARYGSCLIITCVDSARFRAKLGKNNRDHSQDSLWLDMGNGDRSAQAIIGHLGNPTTGVLRCPNVFDLFPELAKMSAQDDELPSCSAEEAIRRQPWPINRVVATAGMEMLWTLLRTARLEHHGTFIDLDPIRTTPLPVDPDVWSFYGYAPKRKRRTKKAS